MRIDSLPPCALSLVTARCHCTLSRHTVTTTLSLHSVAPCCHSKQSLHLRLRRPSTSQKVNATVVYVCCGRRCFMHKRAVPTPARAMPSHARSSRLRTLAKSFSSGIWTNTN